MLKVEITPPTPYIAVQIKVDAAARKTRQWVKGSYFSYANCSLKICKLPGRPKFSMEIVRLVLPELLTYLNLGPAAPKRTLQI
jgi:hypothetical protein